MLRTFDYSQKQPADMLYKKGVLKNSTKFIRKHMHWSLFFNKVVGLRPATLLKKENRTQIFCCELCEIF